MFSMTSLFQGGMYQILNIIFSSIKYKIFEKTKLKLKHFKYSKTIPRKEEESMPHPEQFVSSSL